MEMQEYVQTQISKDTLDKLLLIDNKVSKENITSNDVINSIRNFKKMDKIGVRFSVVSDGKLDSIINILLNYPENINYIYSKYNRGIIIYLVSIINEGYNLSIDVEEKNLDISYLNSNVILTGSIDFITKYKDKLNNKNILIYN